jgi:mono/diheme cytochrome c family protein
LKFVIGFLSAIVLFILVGLLFIYLGIINVSATEEEPGLMRWVLVTTKEISVRNAAKDIEVPDLSSSNMIRKGYLSYQAMCEVCHGGPGVKKSGISRGLNPPAPDLTHSVTEWSDAELFWITKNGIKMTGMPAWDNHTDAEIWNIIAFLNILPGMQPDEYEDFQDK